MDPIRNSELVPGLPRPRGRRPRPDRCVVQVRTKMAGKKSVSFSFTIALSLVEAMQRLQDVFEDVRSKFSRSTDDPRW